MGSIALQLYSQFSVILLLKSTPQIRKCSISFCVLIAKNSI